MYKCWLACMYVCHMCVTNGSQRRTSDPLEPELQLLTMWVVGIEPGSSLRAANALNH